MSVFLCDNKPSTIAPGTSAEGDPQSNGAAERSRNVTKGHVRSIKPAVGSASGVDVPADRKKSVWEGAPLFSLRSLVNKSGEYPLDSRFEQGRYFGTNGGNEHSPYCHYKWCCERQNNHTTSEPWNGSLLDEARGGELALNAADDHGGRSGISALVLQPQESVPVPPPVTDSWQVRRAPFSLGSPMQELAVLVRPTIPNSAVPAWRLQSTTTARQVSVERARERFARCAEEPSATELQRARHRLGSEGELLPPASAVLEPSVSSNCQVGGSSSCGSTVSGAGVPSLHHSTT